jgi:hypothetical protein
VNGVIERNVAVKIGVAAAEGRFGESRGAEDDGEDQGVNR